MSSDGGRERPDDTPPNSAPPNSAPDLRLGRRPTSLVGTVIPPAILVTLSTIFWFGPVAERSSFGPILPLLIGWTASEFASWRCNVDVRRGRLSNRAYAADGIALRSMLARRRRARTLFRA